MQTETTARSSRRELTDEDGFTERQARALERLCRKRTAYIAEKRPLLPDLQADIRALALRCKRVIADIDRLGGRWEAASDDLVLDACLLFHHADDGHLIYDDEHLQDEFYDEN